MTGLNSCNCAYDPKKLIVKPGKSPLQRYACGDCCQRCFIEFVVQHTDTENEIMEKAITAWNAGEIDDKDICQCDMCNNYYKYVDGGFRIQHEWSYHIFFSKQKPPEICGDYCLNCSKKLTPWVYLLRDAYELKSYVNKLKRAINERKKIDKDNGATARATCRYNPGCYCGEYGS